MSTKRSQRTNRASYATFPRKFDWKDEIEVEIRNLMNVNIVKIYFKLSDKRIGRMCMRAKNEKIFLIASQFEHRGPLKIENEKVDLEQVNDEDDTRAVEKHFTFAEQHEVRLIIHA
ncbi:unnamed protein product [Brugia timori]|uniref:MSP domain-containing protein n=1 Tax=Brugia timori TaxID=42155 RepID=A0A0R3R972_9BILA|nr:unnamed protein product [Brugia timori]